MKNISKYCMLLTLLAFTACKKDDLKEGEQPVADFDYEVNIETLEVKFFSKSEKAETYRWEFGDDLRGVSNLENPVYTYSSAGVYEITLTVTNGDYKDSVTKKIPVQKIPVADFTFTIDAYTGTVTFQNKSTDASSYSWDFGDNVGTSTEENPVYTYDASGKYTVTLSVANGNLTSEKSQDIEVTVKEPEADFTYVFDQQTGKVTFTNKSVNASSYTWEFGVNYIQSSNETNPAVTYWEPGEYTVKLVASAGTRSSEKTETLQLTVPEGSKFINIIVDGKIDDWKDIPEAAGDWGRALDYDNLMTWGTAITGLKVAMTENNLYVLFSGTSALASSNITQYWANFDLDNNMDTGSTGTIGDWARDGKMGCDLFFEGQTIRLWKDGEFVNDPAGSGSVVFTTPSDYYDEGTGIYYKEWKFDLKGYGSVLEQNGINIKVGDNLKVTPVMKGQDWVPIGTPVWSDDTDDYKDRMLSPIEVERSYVEWK